MDSYPDIGSTGTTMTTSTTTAAATSAKATTSITTQTPTAKEASLGMAMMKVYTTRVPVTSMSWKIPFPTFGPVAKFLKSSMALASSGTTRMIPTTTVDTANPATELISSRTTATDNGTATTKVLAVTTDSKPKSELTLILTSLGCFYALHLSCSCHSGKL